MQSKKEEAVSLIDIALVFFVILLISSLIYLFEINSRPSTEIDQQGVIKTLED